MFFIGRSSRASLSVKSSRSSKKLTVIPYNTIDTLDTPEDQHLIAIGKNPNFLPMLVEKGFKLSARKKKLRSLEVC